LIPAFGLLWGSLFLDETISQWMIIGYALILTGVALTTGLLKLNYKQKTIKN
jgi:drug/metabolite transporter (DMT)-like permease